MVSSEIKNRFLQRLLNYQDNRVCVDCQKEQVEYANLSFGSFICEKCFLIHLSTELPETLKHLEDVFEIEDLLKLSSGGNSALKEFFSYYELNLKAISYKYVTICAEYYKSLILALSQGQHFDLPLPSRSAGLEASILLDSFVDRNIEFAEFRLNPELLGQQKRKTANKRSFFQRLAKSISSVLKSDSV